jgi:hypothetical protein
MASSRRSEQLMAHPVWGRPTTLAEIRLGLESRTNPATPIDTFIVYVMV